MITGVKSSFLIAAPKSNSGKTLLTLGMLHALMNRGLKVQPFKCGPDYIDPMHHTQVVGFSSYNLDLWMASKEHVQQLYHKQSEMADVSIVEGVMGLFDGATKDEGSSAAIARALNLPVVLVVDAASVAYSIAPLLYGFKHFDLSIKYVGVIFNKVASESHFQFLKEAAFDVGITVLGYIPRDERLMIKSRHLGLHLPCEHKNLDIVKTAAALIEKHVDVDLLLKLSKQENKLYESAKSKASNGKLKIALAKDEAFNFSYQANKDILKELGAVQEFSPLHDSSLPDADLVWLPGGYPEIFAKELAANNAMKQAICDHVKAGKALIAECGGMMYLGKKIITKEDKSFAMAGVFDFDTSFKNMKLHLGYRELSKDGFSVRGHEFHYSNLIDAANENTNFEVKTARGKTIAMPVFRTQNCWASYLHLYLGENEKMTRFLSELEL
jgi:cobyrinic acid a,c-diamide synthase